tara:strand:- start:68 stop:712 length:645 start_codon:yes stop_codon:yes gene_type:complete
MKEKNDNQFFIIFISIFLLIVGMYAFYDFDMKKKEKEENSLSNVENCINDNKSDLVDIKNTRNSCAKKYQKKVNPDISNGRASFKRGNTEYVDSFSGYTKNVSTNYIITSIKVEAKYYAPKGGTPEKKSELFKKLDEKNLKFISFCKKTYDNCIRYSYSKLFENLWVQPNEKYSFKFLLNDDSNKISFNDLKNNKKNDDNWNWSSTAYGIYLTK